LIKKRYSTTEGALFFLFLIDVAKGEYKKLIKPILISARLVLLNIKNRIFFIDLYSVNLKKLKKTRPDQILTLNRS